MNGYYQRRPSLSFEEFWCLNINEIEFVSDLGEIVYQRDSPNSFQADFELANFIEQETQTPN